VVRELTREYPDADIQADDSLFVALTHAHLHSRRRFVILTDEWDAPFRIDRNDTAVRQIQERLLVGVSCDKEDRNKRHTCMIERVTLP